jgi:chromosome segregation ATPase
LPLISSGFSALYCRKFELSRFETFFEVFMASMAEGQLAFEGSASDFHQLEEKVYRTIELLKAARIQKAATEQELATMRDMLDAQAAETEALRKQLEALQQKRAEVRTRVEKLLGDVDAILEQ